MNYFKVLKQIYEIFMSKYLGQKYSPGLIQKKIKNLPILGREMGVDFRI